HRGIKDMKHLPSAIFFVDGICEKIAIAEAKTLGIPVMGIVDSNTDPTNIDFPIPGNDDSMKSIGIIVDYIANCAIEAQGGSVEEVAEVPTAEVETASALDSTEVVEEVAEVVVEESNVEQK
ncbi:MAG: 30S ribosomal protein S2, partial [Candidatus Marinimicrobia bacterium]|nr:30S ribosomal protein S2 [Candidatus Neomarinimicrobiota bacterium]